MIHDRDKLILKWYKHDGMVSLDSELGIGLGFTSDKFDGYLWHEGGSIWVSFIESIHQGQGNLKKLFDAIEENGFMLIVPTPFARMQHICEQRGMKMYRVLASGGDMVEAMCLPPPMPEKFPNDNKLKTFQQ